MKDKRIILLIIFFFFSSLLMVNTQLTKSQKNTHPKSIQQPKKPKSGLGSDKWMEILNAFEKHEFESKNLLKKYASENIISLEKKLAEILLKEWDIIENSYDLSQPYPIKYGRYKLIPGRKFPSCRILIELKVNSIGGVEEAKIIKSPFPNPPINIEGYKKSIFRPAFDGKKFVPGNHQFGIQLAGR